MNLRKTVSIFLATAVMSASFAAVADAATNRRHSTHRVHATTHHPVKARAAAPRNAAGSATDALNQRSLDGARSGAAR